MSALSHTREDLAAHARRSCHAHKGTSGRHCRIKGSFLCLLHSKLSQCEGTYFIYVVERVAFEGRFDGKLEAMLGHARHNKCLNGLCCLIALQLEECLDMDNLTTNGQNPGSHPCLVTLFAFLLWAQRMMADGRGEGRKPMLFTGDDIPRFDHEIDDLE